MLRGGLNFNVVSEKLSSGKLSSNSLETLDINYGKLHLKIN